MKNDPNGTLAGHAHAAAFAATRPEPSAGWRNSYNPEQDPEMAEAHLAAHHAMDDWERNGETRWVVVDETSRVWLSAYAAAWNAVNKAHRLGDTTPYLELIPLDSDGNRVTE